MTKVTSRPVRVLELKAAAVATAFLTFLAWNPGYSMAETRANRLGVMGNVSNIAVEEALSGIEIGIECDREIGVVKNFTLTSPSRLVVDIEGFQHSEKSGVVPIHSSLLENLRLGNYPDKVRFVIDSTSDEFPKYYLKVENNRLTLSVPNAGSSIMQGVVRPPDEMKAEESTSLRETLRGIKIDEMAGKTLVRIPDAKRNKWNLFELSDNTLAVSIQNVSVPESSKGKLDPASKESLIKYVEVYPSMDVDQKDARIIVEMSGKHAYKVLDEGEDLVLEISKIVEEGRIDKETQKNPVEEKAVVTSLMPAENESIRAKGTLMEVSGEPASVVEAPAVPSSLTGSVPLMTASVPKEMPMEMPIAGSEPPTLFFEPSSRFVGQKISIDVQDAEIQNILRLIADISGLNMIISEDVVGKITIRLKNIPWDQALDIILKTKALGQEREGNIIRIAPLEKIEREREQRLAAKKSEELLEPVRLRILPVNFADVVTLLPKLQQIASKREDSSIDMDKRTNSVIIKDTDKVLGVMTELIKSLDTPTPQVLIEARIVEANINFTRELGVQWGAGYIQSPETGNPTSLTFPNTWSIGSPFGPYLVDLPAAAGPSSGTAVGVSLSSIDNTLTLDIVISALEDTGQGKLISSPRIITLDNEEARIEQGFDIPFRTVSEEGAEVSFQSANLELSVTPHITPDESIIMELTISNDAPDFSQTVEGNPLVSRKTAETKVLIKNGETAVIGGIFTVDTKMDRNTVPWLGDIPVLGLFFRHENEVNDKKELVVFITPTIIKRVGL